MNLSEIPDLTAAFQKCLPFWSEARFSAALCYRSTDSHPGMNNAADKYDHQIAEGLMDMEPEDWNTAPVGLYIMVD